MANDKFYESVGAEAGSQVTTKFFKSKLKVAPLPPSNDSYLRQFQIPQNATTFEIIKQGG